VAYSQSTEVESLYDAESLLELFCISVFLDTVKRVQILKHVGWHTFRRTFSTLLKANGEDIKVVQELLRHATIKMTLEVYAQAVTPAKRQAQSKVVEMLREKTGAK
jgi:integrase